MENSTPLSRVEDILQSTIDSTEYDKPPQSRVEKLLIDLKEVIEDGGDTSAYHPAGSVDSVAELPAPSADYLGYVYDVTQDFTTTSDFKEGAGKRYPAGSNIAIVDVGTPESPSYKYDVLSGFIDTSNFVEKEEGKGLSTNDYTDADKTKLASLENYDDTEIRNEIAAKADDADLAAVAKSGAYSDLSGTPTIPSKTSDLTNDAGFVTNQINDASAGNNSTYSSNKIVSEISGEDISNSTTGINPSITDGTDANVQGLTLYGRSEVVEGEIESIGDSGELDVQTCGKNLFDKNARDTNNGFVANAWINNEGSTVSDINRSVSEYISIIPNTQYYLSPTKGASPSLCFYDANKVFISGLKYNDFGYLSFVSPANAKYIRFTIYNTDIDITQIELGSTATAYEPYVSTTATITTGIPLYSVGDVKDELDKKKGVVVKRCEKVVLDGSEDWAVEDQSISSATGSKRCVIYEKTDKYIAIMGSTEIAHAICDNLQVTNADITYGGSIDGVISLRSIDFSGDIRMQICLRIASISTAADLKTYLASNPVTVVYELATPTTQELTTAEKSALLALRTFDCTTNVAITDSPFVDISYLKNTANGKAIGQIEHNVDIKIELALSEKQDALTFDDVPTEDSTNPVTSGGVWSAIQGGGGDVSTSDLNEAEAYAILQGEANKTYNETTVVTYSTGDEYTDSLSYTGSLTRFSDNYEGSNFWTWLNQEYIIGESAFNNDGKPDFIRVGDTIPIDCGTHGNYIAEVVAINAYQTVFDELQDENPVRAITFRFTRAWDINRYFNPTSLIQGNSSTLDYWTTSDLYLYCNSLEGNVFASAMNVSTTTHVDYTSDGIYYNLPADLKTVIAPKCLRVPKRYNSSTLQTSDSGTVERNLGKIWIPTEREVYGQTIFGTNGYSASGSPYLLRDFMNEYTEMWTMTAQDGIKSHAVYCTLNGADVKEANATGKVIPFFNVSVENY